MISSVTLDDATGTPVTLHQDATNGKRWLTSATGLRGIQNLRDDKRVAPQRHGGINGTKYEDGRNITLVGEIMSQVSIEDAMNEWALIATPMMQTLDTRSALLKWTEGATGNALQRLVKLDGDLDPPFQSGASVLSYQAQFFAEDPRAYSQTLTQVTSSTFTSTGGVVWPDPWAWIFNPGAGGQATVTQAGNRATPPVFRIHGGVVNPKIIRLSDQRRISLVGTIGTGDYLDIDVQARTFLLNGTSNAIGLLDSANTDWRMELPAGPTSETYTLSALSNDTSAYLDIFYRSAFA